MTNSKHHQADLLQERLGLKIASRLSDASDALPHDIGERLRHARMQAVSRRKAPAAATAEAWLYSGASAVLGGSGPNWWQRMGAALPVLALVVGLVAIDAVLDDRVAQQLANVDAALLMDDLPPAAYADPGFLQFLKLNQADAPER